MGMETTAGAWVEEAAHRGRACSGREHQECIFGLPAVIGLQLLHGSDGA